MKHLVILLAIFTMLGIWMIWQSPRGVVTKAEIHFWNIKDPIADRINEHFDLPDQPSILYLDPGDAVFYFHANSSCRYSSPLVLARDTDTWNTKMLPQYWDQYNCTLGYQGEYIIMDMRDENWFFENATDRQPIIEMISRNYSLVFNEGWRVFRRN